MLLEKKNLKIFFLSCKENRGLDEIQLNANDRPSDRVTESNLHHTENRYLFFVFLEKIVSSGFAGHLEIIFMIFFGFNTVLGVSRINSQKESIACPSSVFEKDSVDFISITSDRSGVKTFDSLLISPVPNLSIWNLSEFHLM